MPDEMFLVPAVLQKHILSNRFVALAKRRWPQNISCPALGFSDLLQFLRDQKALEAQIFVQPVPVNAART